MHSLLKRFLLIAGLLTATLFLGTLGFTYVEGWPFFGWAASTASCPRDSA